MRLRSLVVGAFIAALALPALAQAPANPPVRIRGTIDKLDGSTLTVNTRDGAKATIDLAPNFAVSTLVKRSVSDIKDNDFVASTNVRKADGKQYAVELRIFPEKFRGRGEGQYNWDLMPNSLMTNATVAGVAKGTDGPVVKVTYKGGESEIIVGPDVPVLGYEDGNAGDLKPGLAVFVIAQKKDDKLTAAGLTVEKNGVKPPQ